MSQLTVSPSLKRVKLSLLLVLAVLVAIVWIYLRFRDDLAWWFLLTALLPFAAPLAGWLDHRRTRLQLVDDALILETGVLAKARRRIGLEEIAAVRVERGFSQRLWGTGNLVVTIRDGGAPIVIADIDQPSKAAEAIRAAGPIQKEKEREAR
jgi:membrane protein YdbS with pleckstrin-like domain